MTNKSNVYEDTFTCNIDKKDCNFSFDFIRHSKHFLCPYLKVCISLTLTFIMHYILKKKNKKYIPSRHIYNTWSKQSKNSACISRLKYPKLNLYLMRYEISLLFIHHLVKYYTYSVIFIIHHRLKIKQFLNMYFSMYDLNKYIKLTKYNKFQYFPTKLA